MSVRNILYNLLEYKTIALFNFAVLVFVSFFGTSPPFRYERSEFGSTNPVNQIVYTSLFLSSLIIVIMKREAVFEFVRKERYLTIFILYCVLSAIWADYPAISFRRSFQLFTVFQVVLTSLILIKFEKQLNVIKVIITLYTIISAISIAVVPEAIDPVFNSPRGLTLQKNSFGQIFVLIFLLYLILNQFSKDSLNKVITMGGLIVSAMFIITSLSTTALVTLLYILALLLIFKVDIFFKDIRIGRAFSGILLFFLIVFAILFSFNSDFLEIVVSQYFGKDLTFTGRTEKWEGMLYHISNHFWFGCGYDSFWDVPGNLNAFFEIGNTAHNGFIEIFNELGFVGFSSMAAVFVAHFYRAVKSNTVFNIVALIAILLLNFTESALFRGRGGLSFVLIWILLFNSLEYFIYKNKFIIKQ
ncbi:O-antigen ligase family protein [Ignavibacterium sp.]|uniref:O-antigen ligase family protein n=1 Tax=Ignavibacterium sp. TaxID=2651167 RepID=UPI00220C47B5|nr:O-antigen ligase family protein [Ignavibacterium sp.]BDQ02773.1 MAG: O-antigen polymerase [Ignavibacterium sp.]